MPERLVTPETTTPREAPPEHPSRGRWLLFLIILVVVAVLAYWFHERSAQQAKAQKPGGRGAMMDRPVPATTEAVTKGDMGVYVEALGTVTPVYTATITSRVQGQIMQVHYKEGQMVRKGDPLIDIDPRPYQAAVTQAEGQLARDKALLEEAQIDLKRYQNALARNAIAQQTVQDQEQVVHQDEGVVKNDEGLLESARVNLDYCHITSPIEGRVGLRLVDPGNIVQATGTTALVVVTQLSPITVIFSVAEDYLPQIQTETKHGHQLTVDALDRTQETVLAHGVLHSIDNQVDVTTGTIKLRAEFPNRDGELFPNQFVNAKLLLNTLKNATLVPNQAIQQSAQGPFVYVVDNGAAKMTPIKTGPANGTDTSVSGVDPGQTVVTAGFDKVQDGSKIATGQPRGPANSIPQTSGPGAPGNPQNPAPPATSTPGNNKGNRGKRNNVTPQSDVNGGKTSK